MVVPGRLVEGGCFGEFEAAEAALQTGEDAASLAPDRFVR
jgi:hypothetical protein